MYKPIYKLNYSCLCLFIFSICNLCLITSCESTTDSDTSPPSIALIGTYTSTISNVYVDSESGSPVTVSLSLSLTFNSDSSGVTTTDGTLSSSGGSLPVTNTSIVTWRVKNDELCLDAADGLGFECERMRNLLSNSFDLHVSDYDMLLIVGKEWISYYK